MIRGLIRLIRPKHWLKNGLIFIPLIFSGHLFTPDYLLATLIGFVVFSLVASTVYIINDTRDIEEDRLHPTKKKRPLASGDVPVRSGLILAVILIVVSVCVGVYLDFSPLVWFLLVVYAAINIAYSFGLKNIPIVDIAILSAGFIIRVLFGAYLVEIEVSSWLYMTVLAGALYLSLGKRRNEIKTNGTSARKVNKHYTIEFLDKNMYVCLSLLLVFYSLWATALSDEGSLLYLTIPLLIVVFMSYSLAVEKSGSSGDPVDILTGSGTLIALAAIYLITTIGLVYI